MEYNIDEIKGARESFEGLKGIPAEVLSYSKKIVPPQDDEILSDDLKKTYDGAEINNLSKSISSFLMSLRTLISSMEKAENLNSSVLDGLSIGILGTEINDASGLKYSDNVWNDDKYGVIGVNSDADGTYKINRVAILDGDQLVLNVDLNSEEYANKSLEEIKSMVAKEKGLDEKNLKSFYHIGLVNGDDSVSDRGWVESDKVKLSNVEDIKPIGNESYVIKDESGNDIIITPIDEEIIPGINLPQEDKDDSKDDSSAKTEKDEDTTVKVKVVGMDELKEKYNISESDVKYASYDEHHDLKMIQLKNGIRIYKDGSYGWTYKDENGKLGGLNCTNDINFIENAKETASEYKDTDLSDFDIKKISSIEDVDEGYYSGRRVTYDQDTYAKFEVINIQNYDTTIVRGIGEDGNSKIGFYMDPGSDELQTGLKTNFVDGSYGTDGVYGVYADGSKVAAILSQANGPWKDTKLIKVLDKYGNPCYMKDSGCGVSTFTNIAQILGVNLTPDELYDIYSTSDRELTKLCEDVGFKVNVLTSKDEIKAELDAGHPVMMRAAGQKEHHGATSFGNRSTGSDGHYIGLLGLTENSNVMLADPGAYSNQGEFSLENNFSNLDPNFPLVISISR